VRRGRTGASAQHVGVLHDSQKLVLRGLAEGGGSGSDGGSRGCRRRGGMRTRP
jgi:hypothetical protein